MKIFLSYASEQRPLAERLFRVLETERYSVFFDRDALKGGDPYEERIRTTIARSDIFIFLISHFSVQTSSYALAELDILQQIPPRRRPAVLPVRTDDTPIEVLPAMLRSITLLEPQGDLGAEIEAAVARMRRRARRRYLMRAIAVAVLLAVSMGAYFYARSPKHPVDPVEQLNKSIQTRIPAGKEVTLIAMASNDGWLASLDIADLRVREILVRLDNEPAFKSTGFSDNLNRMTGTSRPNYQIQLPGKLGQRHEVVVKYITGDGHERGPFTLEFDPRAEYVRQTKKVLNMVSWIEFREFPKGRLLAYFSSLLSSKNAFREIRYSVDSDALDRRVKFSPDWTDIGPPEISDDEMVVEIPMTTTFLVVKLFFIDGTESESKRINLSEASIRGR